MAYRVLVEFNDPKDGKFYKVGEQYKGEVLESLLNTNNQYHTAFIEKVDDKDKENKKENNEEQNEDTDNTEVDEIIKPIEDLNVDDIKKLLDKKKIDYKGVTKKADLYNLLK